MHTSGRSVDGHTERPGTPSEFPASRAPCARTPPGVRRGSSYPFSAPSVVDMILRWKMKNRIATGIVIKTAAASFSGN